MTLTAKKLAHMAKLYPKILQQRTQSITLVCKNADGSTTPREVDGIWRAMQDADPALTGATGQTDILAMFLESDVSLATLRSVAYAYPTTPQGAEPAGRYLITALAPRGFPVGTDRIFVTLRRQR
jgi:hypothetical protein